ncbi:MAG: hypothetical protein JWN12_460 [Candidatus Saccharibacteria bacterium]|nr:hypothetical protein [Candidatus Saccharibacteria bacterium]
MASPNSTLPNDEKEAQDSAYNPGEQHARELNGEHDSIPGYNRSNDGLDDHPISAGGSSGVEPPDSAAAIRDAEDEGGNWKSVYGGNKSKGGRTVTPMNVRAILKKRGPLGLIALLGLGGGLVGTALFSPGLLLVQMKETLVNRMNTQLTSMDARTTKLLGLKVKSLTSGICGSTISVKCRYATMSDTQVKNFEKAGIKVNSSQTGITGRAKPDTLEFKGKQIDASNFDSEFNSNTEFRSALKNGYNPKFGGFTDSVWTKVATKLGINKTKALPEGDTAAKEKALQDETKNGSKLTIPADDGIVCDDKGGCTKNGEKLTGADLENAKAIKAAAAAAAEQAAQETGNEAAKVIGETAGGAVKTVSNFIKVTGVADDACTAYSSVRALGYAAKTVRAVQLAHYALVFLNAADQIKAGTFSSADGAYLGGILTNVTYDAVSGAKRKAAMDSFGMQYAMYGTGGKSDSYVTQFMAGGGLTGNLIAVTDYINTILGNSPLSVCRNLQNPAVQFGSIAAGIGLMFIPGVNVAVSVGDVVKGLASAAVQVGLALLPSLLKDIVAGNVLNGIVGEDAGNAIASGSGKIMSDLSAGGGNGLMSVSDAVAYSQAQSATVAQYSAEDRLTANPLDATNSNTFLGSMVSKILPYTFNLGNIGGSVTNIGSFVGSSLGSLIPQSSALSTENLRQSYSSCNDVDYKSMGIATDPMCNPIYGVPTQYMNIDPQTVVDDLVRTGQIDANTGAAVDGSTYASYLNNCVNRTTPIGDVGTSFDQNPGTECIINNQQTAEFSLFTVDQRVQNGMDGVSTDPSAQNTTSAYEFYAPTGTSTSVAANTQSQNQYTAVNAPSVAAAVPMKALAVQFTTTDCLISDKTSTVTPLSYKIAYGIV